MRDYHQPVLVSTLQAARLSDDVVRHATATPSRVLMARMVDGGWREVTAAEFHTDVRAVAKLWDLPTWDKPASPCLSSRLVPGLAVTAERTTRIEAAEAYLKRLGLRDCRVRLHEGELARIEVPIAEIAILAEPAVRGSLAREFRELGFRFVTLDLEGFRSGSLNDLVGLEIKRQYSGQSRSREPS